MEVEAAFAVGDGLTAETPATAAAVAGPAVSNEELPMPTAPGSASLKTRFACLAQLITAVFMASVFIGVPLAAALHVVVYEPVLDIVFAAAITCVLALTVAYVVLKTGKSVGVSPA
jgi:hypothetical protein